MVPGQGDRRRVDQGSVTPLMMAVVALSLLAVSFTARVGEAHLHKVRVDAAADAVALALATGDEELARIVASRNQVRIVDLDIRGTVNAGFDAIVTVVTNRSPAESAMARASTKP